ncbi:hypothetical protein G6F68_014644 [Rhizopus microsporus]|nr:hypothetical protein G6F68_014644 [Rhizopus microsporus]
MWAMPVIEHLGIRPTFIDSTMLGGSSFVAHLMPALHALASGQCNAVLVCYGSTQRTSTLSRAEIGRVRKQFDPQPYETPYDPLSPLSSYALAAARHMHQYGTRREHLAQVALAANQWAQLNPEAQLREAATLDQILSARMTALAPTCWCAPTVRATCRARPSTYWATPPRSGTGRSRPWKT